jgi:hypothetical protein
MSRKDYGEFYASVSQRRDRINPCTFCFEKSNRHLPISDPLCRLFLNAYILELEATFYNLS